MKRVFVPQWTNPPAVEIPDELRQAIGGPSLLLETLVRRGFSDPVRARAFLDPNTYTNTPATSLPDLAKGAQRITSAIQNHEKIGIWGDFDVDGQTSTAVLVSGLRKLGADVVYHIPIREKESHGILLEPLKTFLATGVRLLISCDTGITAHESVTYAMQSGVDVIITDHHSLPEALPEAYAVINPQLVPSDHPLHTLSGVGVTYKLVEQLFINNGAPQGAEDLLDLVALGLIADLAILTGDARYLVQKGLALMRAAPRPGLARILSENKIAPGQVNEETISFTLAPRLNAVGRLSDANPMVDFLLTEDPVIIATTCNQIEGLNAQRKILCDQVFKGAQAQLEQNPRLLENSLILLAHPEWPGGVVGIVASRLVDLYHRPAILMNTSDPGTARGSARSIDGVNITQALRENKTLLKTFGGHPMAAGLSIAVENIEALRRGLSRSIDLMIERSDLQPTLEVDATIDLENLDLDLLNSLERLSPFGPGNPPLQFAIRDLDLESVSPLGRTKEHLQVTAQTPDGSQYRFIWWQGAELPRPEGRFDLVIKAHASQYRGKVEAQFEWVDFREHEENTPGQRRKKRNKTVENFDFRASLSPETELINLSKTCDLLVWSEGIASCPLKSYDRTQLTQSSALAIWTPPPSPAILQQALEVVAPDSIYWFAKTVPESDSKVLIQRCASLLKKVLTENDEIELELPILSARMATTPQITALAIHWLDSQGKFKIIRFDSEHISISVKTGKQSEPETKKYQRQLLELNQEVNAYRSLYRKTQSVAYLLPEALRG